MIKFNALEKALHLHLTPCDNKLCKEGYFPENKEIHLENCLYGEFNCPWCKQTINCATFINHCKLYCNKKFSIDTSLKPNTILRLLDVRYLFVWDNKLICIDLDYGFKDHDLEDEAYYYININNIEKRFFINNRKDLINNNIKSISNPISKTTDGFLKKIKNRYYIIEQIINDMFFLD